VEHPPSGDGSYFESNTYDPHNTKLEFVPGDRLIPGFLRLQQGIALLRFDGGAMVVIRGPSEIRLESPGSAVLLAGAATVRSADEAAGFLLRTEAVDVVDIGTEVHVSIERPILGSREKQIP
jgi:hypothetical protein